MSGTSKVSELLREMLSVMRGVPLFKDFSEDQLVRIGTESELRRMRTNETICREGEYGSVFWVILGGLVKVLKRGEDGKPIYIASLGQGNFFGEMGPMSAQPRSATCVAETDGFLLEVPEETFFFFRDKVPSFKKIIDDAYHARALITHLTIAPIFKGISRDALQAVVDAAKLVTVAKDAPITTEGQPSEAFYLVRHGYARVTRKKEDRDEIVAYLRDNTYFGEQALLGGGNEVASVTAMSELELVVIPRDAFEAVAARFPELAERRRILAAEQVERLKEIAAVPESGKMEVLIRRGLVQTREALVIHTEKCTKCELCVQSCSAVHGGHPLIQLTGMRMEDLLLPASCYNCKTPECMLACRFGCITRDRSGQIYINEDTCTGCTLCSRKCPYGTIFMVDREEEVAEKGLFARIFGLFAKGETPPAPPAPEEAPARSQKKAKRLAVKCDLCMGHGFTACVYNCPTGAIERVNPEKLYEML